MRTICLGRYSERVRALGLLPYFLFFVGMVYQLIRLGAIKGTELVLDSSFGVMAIGLLAATVALYGFKVGAAWANAAYWNYAFLDCVRRVLGAVPVVDYNLRRKGKKFLATLFFVDQWRRVRAPRTDIERCFAQAKRYFGLKHF